MVGGLNRLASSSISAYFDSVTTGGTTHSLLRDRVLNNGN